MGELPDYPEHVGHAPKSTDDERESLERRETELEIKAAYADDLLETHNTQVARQQDLIETLVREMRRQQERQSKAENEPPRSLRDELPPHY